MNCLSLLIGDPYRILILAAAVFYTGPDSDGDSVIPAGLFEAHDLIKARVGSG